MSANKATLSTGLPGLDSVLQGLRAGDNVVWEVDSIQDYIPVLEPLCHEARRIGRKLIYFRFARHAPLLSSTSGAEIREFDPQEGFERFLTGILDVIEQAGPGAFYVFDCLSDLAADWFSDRMLGNFFMIACPYLYELDTIAYFALEKNVHSLHATQSIAETAQVIIEVYRKERRFFIHPMKVWQRHSPTMYTLHRWEGKEFKPVTNSATITDLLVGSPKPRLEFSIHRPGFWVHTFQQAQQTLHQLRQGTKPDHDPVELFQRLMKMIVTRDERFQTLAEKHFTLADLVEVMQRMIGTGLIGGKSLGMLLARAILAKGRPKWRQLLESHDSFFVGSDVFYTYLVQNGCWWLRRRQKDFNLFLKRAEEARHKMLKGAFPEGIQSQFMEMLEYFGQSPLIVRSSSLLEDNYGNAFSGKYESVFCANQGTPQERLETFMDAVRTVYASAMSEEGLRYRQHHGLLDRDEQMALLVQRVSGELYGNLFFPHLAGVGFSFNPFAWNRDIDPRAGMLRLVFGLGTRAVDRHDDDYARLIALNAPLQQPQAGANEVRRFAQRQVDVLDLNENQLVSRDFEEVAPCVNPELLDLFAADDRDRLPGASTATPFSGMLTFERMLQETRFVPSMREICRTLQQAYNSPVDVEFTANFTRNGKFRINLLQCRPFQVKIGGDSGRLKLPKDIPAQHIVLQTGGPVIGHSVTTTVDRLIYVVPSVYSQMRMVDRYSVARTIGKLTHLHPPDVRPTIMLIGPGRWGTSMPSVGVPVSFAEINTVSIICELTLMHEGLVPDVSLGTHFFNDLVEMDMLYLAVSPDRQGHRLNENFLLRRPNRLLDLVPSANQLAPALRVLDFDRTAEGTLFLNVDSLKQRGVCYVAGEP